MTFRCLIFLACLGCTKSMEKPAFLNANNADFFYQGIVYNTTENNKVFTWSGSALSFDFKGESLNFFLNDNPLMIDNYGDSTRAFFSVKINNQLHETFELNPSKKKYKVIINTKDWVEISLIRESEAMAGYTIFEGLETSGEIRPIVKDQSLNLLFIGNSITTAYGILGDSQTCRYSTRSQKISEGYAFKLAQQLKANFSIFAWSGKGLVRNYDKTTVNTIPELFFEGFPVTGLNFTKDIPPKPDLIFIHLGTNDFAHEIPRKQLWVDAYLNFLADLSDFTETNNFILMAGPTLRDGQVPGSQKLTTIKNFLDQVAQIGTSRGHQIKVIIFEGVEGAHSGCDSHPDLKANQEMFNQILREIN